MTRLALKIDGLGADDGWPAISERFAISSGH